MSASTLTLLAAVFGASTVEMVEALTIVVAVGATRGWRWALEGAGSALALLLFLVATIGVAIIHYVPLNALRIVVGTLLLVMGESWLSKAILRGSGHRDRHDEDQVFAATAAELGAEGSVRQKRDTVAFMVAFKGVFLEGVEVVIIVISLGGSQHRLGPAAAAAGAAALVVGAAGLFVARQLREVPENVIKWGVGVMLTSLGLYWMGEGVAIRWPGGDLAIPVLIGAFLVLSLAVAAALRTLAPSETSTARRESAR